MYIIFHRDAKDLLPPANYIYANISESILYMADLVCANSLHIYEDNIHKLTNIPKNKSPITSMQNTKLKQAIFNENNRYVTYQFIWLSVKQYFTNWKDEGIVCVGLWK